MHAREAHGAPTDTAPPHDTRTRCSPLAHRKASPRSTPQIQISYGDARRTRYPAQLHVTNFFDVYRPFFAFRGADTWRPELIRFEPAGRGGVSVRRIRGRANRSAATPMEFGVTTTSSTLSRERYDALVQDLLLIRAATFRWRGDAPKLSRRARSEMVFYTRTRIRLGRDALSHELHSKSATEWDAARIWISVDRI